MRGGLVEFTEWELSTLREASEAKSIGRRPRRIPRSRSRSPSPVYVDRSAREVETDEDIIDATVSTDEEERVVPRSGSPEY